jgi:uncharacterized protein YabE (DUF348 family)
MRKIVIIIVLFALSWYALANFVFSSRDPRETFGEGNTKLTLVVNGNTFPYEHVTDETIEAFLIQSGYTLQSEDNVFPGREERILPGMRILYTPARSVRLLVDGQDDAFLTTAQTTSDILNERNVTLDEDDIVEPARENAIPAKTKIVVTRVEIKEEVKEVPIAFTTKTIEDDELSWRKKVVKQKGEKGVKRTTYRVSYHDGKEINRRVLKTETTKVPVEEIVTQGTYVKVGKAHRGGASWYAWTGTMAAANPWLPKGSFVKVTNMENGKSVIVVINDRGPFVPGRIIDLDKVAFEKIASLGAGVINVKMEEITN